MPYPIAIQSISVDNPMRHIIHHAGAFEHARAYIPGHRVQDTRTGQQGTIRSCAPRYDLGAQTLNVQWDNGTESLRHSDEVRHQS